MKKMNNVVRNILVALFLFLAAVAGFILVTNSQMLPQQTDNSSTESPFDKKAEEQMVPVNKKAAFLIFTDGTQRDFSDARYHNRSEEVFIATDSPTTVHVTSQGKTWGDFFATLPMKLTNTCLTTGTGQQFCDGTNGSLRFFVNNEEVTDFVSREIEDGDRALITFGNSTDNQIQVHLRKVPNP
jgi:hypothetical protein